jgi:hypothetical protein
MFGVMTAMLARNLVTSVLVEAVGSAGFEPATTRV